MHQAKSYWDCLQNNNFPKERAYGNLIIESTINHRKVQNHRKLLSIFKFRHIFLIGSIYHHGSKVQKKIKFTYFWGENLVLYWVVCSKPPKSDIEWIKNLSLYFVLFSYAFRWNKCFKQKIFSKQKINKNNGYFAKTFLKKKKFSLTVNVEILSLKVPVSLRSQQYLKIIPPKLFYLERSLNRRIENLGF